MNYWDKIIPTLVGVIVGSLFGYTGYLLNQVSDLRTKNDQLLEGIREVEKTYVDIRGCKLGAPYPFIVPPVQAVFKDGVLNYINWTYLQKEKEGIEEKIFNNYNSLEDALIAFQHHVTETTLSELESHNSFDARVKRREISDRIMRKMNQDQDHYFELFDHIFLGFCVPTS